MKTLSTRMFMICLSFNLVFLFSCNNSLMKGSGEAQNRSGSQENRENTDQNTKDGISPSITDSNSQVQTQTQAQPGQNPIDPATQTHSKPRPDYYQLSWGIENCIDGTEDRQENQGSFSIHPPCLGDCDDAFVVIFGELNLIKKDGMIFIVSNKDQKVGFQTYSGTWTYWKPINSISSDQSYLVVKILDESYNPVTQKHFKLHLNTQAIVLDPFIPESSVEFENIYVKKGQYIDIGAQFGGTIIGTSECPRSSSQLTGNSSYQDGYYLREIPCTDPNLSAKNKELGGYHDNTPIWCCGVNDGHCSQKPGSTAQPIEGRHFSE